MVTAVVAKATGRAQRTRKTTASGASWRRARRAVLQARIGTEEERDGHVMLPRCQSTREEGEKWGGKGDRQARSSSPMAATAVDLSAGAGERAEGGARRLRCVSEAGKGPFIGREGVR